MYSRILCKLDTIMAGFLVFDLYKVFSSYTLEGCGCNFIVDFYLHPQCVLYVIKLTSWISCLGCKNTISMKAALSFNKSHSVCISDTDGLYVSSGENV